MSGAPESPLGHQEGILRPKDARERIEIGRAAPGERLASYVDYHWWVTWHVPDGVPHRQEVIPRPVSHVSAELVDGVPRMLVHGVWTTRFDRVLSGDGRSVASAFRPGGLRPFLARSSSGGLAGLRDREVPAEDLLGVDDRPLARLLVDTDLPAEDGARALEQWLLDLDPPEDPVVDEVAALVARAESDSLITRAEQLADLAGVTLRTLQRQFSSYVGVGPKWVVQRCRLLDVAAAAHQDGESADWAGLAAELGYADQSHLIRAFTRIVGDPPAAYTRAHV